MFNFTKKITSLLLAIILILSCAVVFVGCGEEENTVPEGLEAYDYDNDGNPTGYFKNEYDDAGNCTTNATYDSKGNLLGYTVNEFDENGNKTKVLYYSKDDTLKAEARTEYDEEGRIKKYTNVDAQGNISDYVVYEYNDMGLENRIYRYKGDDTLKSYTEYEYNDKKECTKMTEYTGAGEVKYYITYEIDENGNEISKRYDAEGNLTEKLIAGAWWQPLYSSTTEMQNEEFELLIDNVIYDASGLYSIHPFSLPDATEGIAAVVAELEPELAVSQVNIHVNPAFYRYITGTSHQ